MKKVSYFENQTNDASLVVTLIEFKAWLKITWADEDAELTMMLTASQDKIACYLNQHLVPDTFHGDYADLEITQFEKYPFISFKKFPFTTLTSVSYWNGTSFTALTVDTDYVLEKRSKAFPRILIKCPQNITDLSADDDIAYPLRVIADVGYADADAVPDLIKTAILMYGALLYNNRGDCEGCACDGDGSATIPGTIRAAIGKYKLREVFG